jgi:tetratricopeptide (TPR) repeat protein/tRNA A-37 threonylcarbamoyl transferase component Bud32
MLVGRGDLMTQPTSPRSRNHWVDSICDDYEDKWSAATPPALADFLIDVAPEDRASVLHELILLDCELRRKNGLECGSDYYLSLLPGDEALVHGALQDLNPTMIAQTAQFSIENTLLRSGSSGFTATCRMPIRIGDVVGNCEILGELGRGGMGVVYRARQRHVQRDVAIKMMRSDFLDSLPPAERQELVERFQNEALATARVSHPNVITVYEVGEHEGLPYFSMYFAQGETLATKLTKGPLDGRTAARYLLPIARGVQAAHDQGILHRDLTPRNILLDKSTDRPMVADFGLAKLLDASQGRTHDGALMGSPPYMSPEQINDCLNVSLATDVYGLGATLYHMLTGRPPFLAATPSATVYQVVNEHPVLPRELNPSLERDIETICVKCLNKDPKQRYASAAALADDLERFIARQPIRARPIGHVERLWRWCLQNQQTASVFVTAITLLTIVSLVATDGYLQAHRSQKVAEAQKAESLRYFQMVCSAVDENVAWISRDPRLRAHGLEDLRRAQLERAASFYEQLVEMRPDDPELLAAQGRAFYQLGQINLTLQEYDSAAKSLASAIGIQQQLRATIPDRDDLTRQAADSFAAHGDALLNNGDLRSADASFFQARVLRRDLQKRQPTDYQALLDVAKSFNDSGRLLEARKNPNAAAAEYREALKALDKAQQTQGNARDTALARASALTNLARVQAQQEQLKAANESYAQAKAAVRLLTPKQSKDPEVLEMLIVCQNNQADIYQRLGDSERAEAAYLEAIVTLTRLVSTHPDVDYYQRNLALARHNLASIYLEIDRRDDAETQHRASLAILEKLVEQQPQVLDFQQHLGRALMLCADLNDGATSVVCLTRAREIFERLSTGSPDVLDYQQDLATCTHKLGVMELERLHLAEAETLLEQALALRRAIVGAASEATEPRSDTAATLVRLGCLYSQTERSDKAREAFNEAAAIYTDLCAGGGSSLFQHNLARTQQNLSLLFASQEEWELAQQHAEQGVTLLEELAASEPGGEALAEELLDGYCYLTNLRPGTPAKEPLAKAAQLAAGLVAASENPRLASLHWQTHLQLAELAENAKDIPAAKDALDQVIAVAEKFLKVLPEDQFTKQRLFRSHEARAGFLTRNAQPKDAIADWRQALALADDGGKARTQVQLACALARVDQAAEASEMLKTLPATRVREQLIETARAYCLLARSLQKTPSPSADEAADIAQHLQRAQDALRAANVSSATQSRLEADEEFEPLRKSDLWQAIWQKPARP